MVMVGDTRCGAVRWHGIAVEERRAGLGWMFGAVAVAAAATATGFTMAESDREEKKREEKR